MTKGAPYITDLKDGVLRRLGSNKSVGLLVNAANHLERRLPAPPQRQLLQTDGAEEHKGEATITL